MRRSRSPQRPTFLRRVRRRALVTLMFILVGGAAILVLLAALDGVFRGAVPRAFAPVQTATPSGPRRAILPATRTATPSATTVMTPIPAASPTAPAPTSGPGQVNPASSDPRFGVAEAAVRPDIANRLGVRWTRIPFIWADLQPDGPRSWNRFALSRTGSDAVIDAEIARGRNVVGILLGSPAWAARYPAWRRASVPKNISTPWSRPLSDDPAATPASHTTNYWGNYAYWLAKHYAGRINQWIIWNEVSIPPTAGACRPGTWTQWFAGCSRAESVRAYARLLEVAYQAIHAANRNAKVVLYGDPYWYDTGAYETALLAVLHRDDPTNAHSGYFDVANLHLYIGAPTFYWIIGGLRRDLARYGWGTKKVWISETNVEPYDDPTAPRPPRQFRVTLDEQSSFLVDAFSVYLAAKTDRIEIYRMFDGPETKAGGAPLGLVNNAGALRPIGHTFKFLVTLFTGATAGSYTTGELFPDPRIGGKAGVFKVVTTKPGYRITTLWNQAGMHADYPRPHWTDPATGVTYDARNDIVFPLREKVGGVSYDRYATATYRLTATAGSATVYDKFGNAVTVREEQRVAINNHNADGSVRAQEHPTTIALTHGVYTVQLRGGATYSNAADLRIPTEGGDPVVILEQRT